MFKKRNRNFRSRRQDSESDDDKKDEDCKIIEPPPPKKAEPKKKKPVAEKMVTSASVLSFQNDEGKFYGRILCCACIYFLIYICSWNRDVICFSEEDVTFKVKKSSHSKRVAKQLKKKVLQEKGIDIEPNEVEKPHTFSQPAPVWYLDQ